MQSKLILITPSGKKRVIIANYDVFQLLDVLHIPERDREFVHLDLFVDSYKISVNESYQDKDGVTKQRLITKYSLNPNFEEDV